MTRLGLAAFAIVLSTVLVPLGITANWLSLRVDNTKAYVDTVAPLADDDELRERLADEVASAAIAKLEVVPFGLPDALDTMVKASTRAVVDNPDFPEFWRDANADFHREFLKIVHHRDKGVVADGWVYIDVGPLLDQVLADAAEQWHIPPALIPPSAPLPVPVVRESQLEKARGAYQVLDGLALWVPLAWAALVALAVLVSPGWRGRLRAAAAAALGVAVGGVLVMLLTSPVTDAVVDQADAANQDLVRLVLDVVAGTLQDTALTAAIGGLVIGLALLGGSLLPGRSGR